MPSLVVEQLTELAEECDDSSACSVGRSNMPCGLGLFDSVETGTPFRARAVALGLCATVGKADPLQATLAALIKGQRRTAPPWASA